MNRAERRREVYDAALDGIRTLLDADRASILLFGEDGRVHFVAWRGLSERYRTAVDGHSPWGPGDADAQPVLVRDVEASDLGPELRAPILEEGHRALAFFPLVRHDRLLGKFMTYYTRPRELRPDDVDLGKVVALHVAAALGRLLDAEALQGREEHFRALIEKSSDLIILLSSDGTILYESPAAEEVLGFHPSERVGRSIFEHVHPEDRVAAEAFLARIRSEPERSLAAELRVRHRGGVPRQLEVRARNLLEHPAVRAVVLNVRDVTDRHRAEAALRASEERYRSLFEESRDAIYISTPSGELLDLNPAGLHLFGFASREEALAAPARTLYWDAAARERFAARMREEGYVRDLEVDLRTVDGDRRRVLETASAVLDTEGRVVAYRGTLRDVTVQRALEEQLRQTQKMEAVGRLAGGVAHDFNNLLTAINGYSELVLRRLGAEDPLRHEVEEIHRAGKRAAELTSQLLTLSRRQVLVPRRLDLNRAVAGLERLLRRVLGEGLELALSLDAAPAAVRGDAGQLEQVLLNLALNARDAMPGGGRLEIATRNAWVDDEGARLDPEVVPGPYVELSVRDTGTGMEPEVLQHIFEPFFTTKERGRGTGLGLSTVYGIVRQNSGLIRVESGPGEGSCFRVLFPAARAPVTGADRRQRVHGRRPGAETVLLVEDERSVRELLATALREAGFTVLEAGDGEEALGLALGDGRIDLLLSDIRMPRLGGGELAAALRTSHPGLRVLFMSGYTERPGSGSAAAVSESATVLQKPFSNADLLAAVEDALDGPSAGAGGDAQGGGG
ncbi:MAG: PAS domain S-box protein [Thermoanaerobaculia bacterium]|nr:PAS domain S-box protein [Thermoanaerobaculia bacterium]